jgi:hypothetical protein
MRLDSGVCTWALGSCDRYKNLNLLNPLNANWQPYMGLSLLLAKKIILGSRQRHKINKSMLCSFSGWKKYGGGSGSQTWNVSNQNQKCQFVREEKQGKRVKYSIESREIMK